MTAKKVAFWLFVAFVVFYVLSAPQSSADLVRSAFGGLGDAASSFSEFLQSLV